jgi:predicted nucleic acid-binding Zn finger protein
MRTAIPSAYVVVEQGGNCFTIRNASGAEYDVDLNRNTCSCSDFIYRKERDGGACKHIELAVRMSKADSKRAESRDEFNARIKAEIENDYS